MLITRWRQSPTLSSTLRLAWSRR